MRPRKPKPYRLELRFSDAEREEIKARAARAGTTSAAWARARLTAPEITPQNTPVPGTENTLGEMRKIMDEMSRRNAAALSALQRENKTQNDIQRQQLLSDLHCFAKSLANMQDTFAKKYDASFAHFRERLMAGMKE